MGLITHLISMGIGFYGGAYVAQNYEIPKLLPPSEINMKSIEDGMESWKKNLSDGLESFQIPVAPSLQELSKKVGDYLEAYKKPEEKK